MAKRNLSPAQIRAGFGGKRRQAAMKHHRREARKAAARQKRAKHMHRSKPAAETPPRRKTRRASSSSAHRTRTRPRAGKQNRANKGGIYHYTLGSRSNPAEKSGKMTATHRRKSRSRRAQPNRAKRNGRHHRNPFGGTWGADIMAALFVVGGAIAAKLGAQVVLGTGNTGPIGYAANLAVGGIGAWIIGGPLKNKRGAASFFSGAVVEVVLRGINDYTPFGQYLQGIGIGDYFASNWVQPQRYVDALHSAQVQIPAGWAPTTVIQSNAAPPGTSGGGGMSGLYDGGSSLY